MFELALDLFPDLAEDIIAQRNEIESMTPLERAAYVFKLEDVVALQRIPMMGLGILCGEIHRHKGVHLIALGLLAGMKKHDIKTTGKYAEQCLQMGVVLVEAMMELIHTNPQVAEGLFVRYQAH